MNIPFKKLSVGERCAAGKVLRPTMLQSSAIILVLIFFVTITASAQDLDLIRVLLKRMSSVTGCFMKELDIVDLSATKDSNLVKSMDQFIGLPKLYHSLQKAHQGSQLHLKPIVWKNLPEGYFNQFIVPRGCLMFPITINSDVSVR